MDKHCNCVHVHSCARTHGSCTANRGRTSSRNNVGTWSTGPRLMPAERCVCCAECWCTVEAVSVLRRRMHAQQSDCAAEAHAQNVCNCIWAMSIMRFQAEEAFTDFLQATLHTTLEQQPGTIHPQNIGDMVQALAVMRRKPHPGLLAACDRWMSRHSHMLLPNHLVAYLNVRPSPSLQRLRGGPLCGFACAAACNEACTAWVSAECVN